VTQSGHGKTTQRDTSEPQNPDILGVKREVSSQAFDQVKEFI
jgi:hypothetical protein